jgi:hypothetical protein
MKKAIMFFFIFSILLFSNNENPLLEKEIFPLSNPSFEENLKDWGGNPKDNYMLMYTYGNIPCKIAEDGYDGKKSLYMELNRDGASYLYRSFKLKVGKKYYVSAKIKTEGNIYGSVRVVYGASGEPSSSLVSPDSKWEEAGVSFTGTKKGQPKDADPSDAYCEIRLQASGKGKIYYDDIRIQELKEYQPYLRVKLLSGEGKYRIKIYSKVGPPKWFFSKVFFAKEGLQIGEFSPWINLGEFEEFKGRGIAYTGVIFEGLSSKKLDEIKAEIDFAYMPDEKTILKRFVRQVKGNIIGIFIPKGENTPTYFVENVKLLKDNAEERNRFVRSLNLPFVELKHYFVEAHLKGYGSFFSDPEIVEKEVNTLRTIGFNAIDSQYSGLATVYRETAEKEGIFQTHHTMRRFNLPFDKETKTFVFDINKIKENIEVEVNDWVERLKKDDPKQTVPIKFVDIGDEIAGSVFGGQGYEDGYKRYLKEHRVKPSELGLKDWDEVKTYGTWNWREARGKRPENRKDLSACRSYYWTLRYWNYANSEVYRIMTETLEKHLPGITTRVNFGPPWLYEYCSYLRGAEIWEFARNRSVSSMWNEDWLNTYGWRGGGGIQMCAFLVDLSRSCAQTRGLETDAYVMPEGKENIQLKLASVIGKGAKKMGIYRYGPAYASPDSWSENSSMVEGVSTFLRKLGKTEDVLFPGKPPKSDVAIVWSQSNDIWRDTNDSITDRTLIYLALLHRQVPVDFIDEKGIEEGKLKDYRVVYLASEYLKRDAQERIEEWVRGGGYLWVDGLGGTGDEYGQKTDILLPVYGIKVKDVVKREDKKLEQPLGKIIIGDSDIETTSIRVNFSLIQPSETEIIGRYEDGQPAIIEHRYKKGKVFYVPTYAGLVYSTPVVRIRGKIETGYRERERKIITDLALKDGIKRPVECSVDCVEVDLLESEKGTGLVLANYTGESQKEIKIRVKTDKKIRSVYSATTDKTVQFKSDTGYVEFNIPLEIVDLITLR